ncbi:MAG: Uma2 family endonuclease [Chloroflexota bacterium]
MIKHATKPTEISPIFKMMEPQPTRAADLPGEINARSQLPTFPMEVGSRTVIDPETGQAKEVPLTLLDILYQTDDDIGMVHVSQNILHDIWCRLLAVMLQTHLTVEKWFVTHDVLIHWGWRGVPPKYPDVAAMPDAHVVLGRALSYHVGTDGPLPAFIAEITSPTSRENDLDIKPTEYAAMGIKEYLIIDMHPEDGEAWQLIGYCLGNNPYYDEITPNVDGSITFLTVNLRFKTVGSERIEVYDVVTGERLLTPDEMKKRAEEEAKRAEEEAKRADDLARQLDELKAKYENKDDE